MKAANMKLEISVTYELNGTNPAILRENLLSIATRAAAEGWMSGGTAAEVETWQSRVSDEPTAKDRTPLL